MYAVLVWRNMDTLIMLLFYLLPCHPSSFFCICVLSSSPAARPPDPSARPGTLVPGERLVCQAVWRWARPGLISPSRFIFLLASSAHGQKTKLHVLQHAKLSGFRTAFWYGTCKSFLAGHPLLQLQGEVSRLPLQVQATVSHTGC